MYSYFLREGTSKYSISGDDSIDIYSDTLLTCIEKITGLSKVGLHKTQMFQIFQN